MENNKKTEENSAAAETETKQSGLQSQQEPSKERRAENSSEEKKMKRERKKEAKRKKGEVKHQRDLIARYECKQCGERLNAYEAFYHWSGMGPLCEECIENDDELSGYKWEPKSSFSY